MHVANRAYPIIAEILHGQDTLYGKHALTQYTRLTGTNTEYHSYNHNHNKY